MIHGMRHGLTTAVDDRRDHPRYRLYKNHISCFSSISSLHRLLDYGPPLRAFALISQEVSVALGKEYLE